MARINKGKMFGRSKTNTNLEVNNANRRFGYTKPTEKMKSGIKNSDSAAKVLKHKKIGGPVKISPFTRPTFLNKKNLQPLPSNVVKINGKWIRKKD
jgi:hypothetical protein